MKKVWGALLMSPLVLFLGFIAGAWVVGLVRGDVMAQFFAAVFGGGLSAILLVVLFVWGSEKWGG